MVTFKLTTPHGFCDNCDAPATHAVSHTDKELKREFHGFSCDACLWGWTEACNRDLLLFFEGTKMA